MDVRSCKVCGNLFNYMSGPPLCPNCVKKMEEKFAQVKEYIYDNPKCGMSEVSEANDVPVPIIRQWIREERLSFAEDSPIGLNCECCGKMIHTGRYCEACKAKVGKRLESAYSKPAPQQAPKPESDHHNKMRFLNN